MSDASRLYLQVAPSEALESHLQRMVAQHDTIIEQNAAILKNLSALVEITTQNAVTLNNLSALVENTNSVIRDIHGDTAETAKAAKAASLVVKNVEHIKLNAQEGVRTGHYLANAAFTERNNNNYRKEAGVRVPFYPYGGMPSWWIPYGGSR